MEHSFGLWKFRLNNERAFSEFELGRLIWLVADVEGEPVASVWGELFPEHDRTGRTMHVVAFRVHPSLQRRGIGRMLLAGLESVGRQVGRRVSTLYVARDNAGAIALYAGSGYSVVGERSARWEFEDPAGQKHVLAEEQFVMMKSLEPSGPASG